MRAFAAGLLVLGAACTLGSSGASLAAEATARKPVSAAFLEQDFAAREGNRAPIPPGVVADGSFEGGTPNSNWMESSTNFGTPLCDAGSCGFGAGTSTPRTGSWWAWFGGVSAYEKGELKQDITIPSSSEAILGFYVMAGVCALASDYLSVTIDGTEVWRIDGSSPLCGVLSHSPQSADVSAWADGSVHTLQFVSETGTGGTTNFAVDDVTLAGGLWFFKIGLGVPGPGDCSNSSQVGRMLADSASGKLYVCDTSGWVTK